MRAKGEEPRKGFFSGYLGDEAATEQAWEGGWFHTGDILSSDGNGLLYFLDRKKKYHPALGREHFCAGGRSCSQHRSRCDRCGGDACADALREEEVFAFVVAKSGQVDAEALMRRLAMRLSYHKLPGFLLFCEALPLNSTQKLQRGQIKTDAEEAVRSGRALDLRALKSQLRKAMAE